MNTSLSSDYSKYGIRDERKQTTTTPLGKTKTLARLYTIEWVFLAVSFLNIFTAIGLTLYRLVVVLRDDAESSDFTFVLLLLINAVFCIFYVIHGVMRERVYELYALMVAIIVVLLYCILEYFLFNTEGQTVVKLVRVIVAIVMAPPNIIMAYLITKGFGYIEFRTVGASEYLQGLYREAAMFSCLLKFDVQAACSVVILALKDGTDMSNLEIVSLCVGLPFSFLWSLFGWVTLRRELKKCAYIFAGLGLLKPAYYSWKIIKEYVTISEPAGRTDHTIVYSVIGAVTVALLVWLMLMIELVFVYKNFGKGLKERVQHFTADNMIGETSSLLGPNGRQSHLPGPQGPNFKYI